MTVSAHHYLFDAAPLLDECLDKLRTTIRLDRRGRYQSLLDLKEVLVYSENLLHRFVCQTLKTESEGLSGEYKESWYLLPTLATLKQVLEEKHRQDELKHQSMQSFNPQDPHHHHSKNSLYTARSATDTLLFRLIVALQLCLLRIDDAHFVITGHRILDPEDPKRRRRMRYVTLAAGCCLVGTAVVNMSRGQRRDNVGKQLLEILPKDTKTWKTIMIGTGITWYTTKWMGFQWSYLWLTDKIVKSTHGIEEWIHQWQAVQVSGGPRKKTGQPEKASSQAAQVSSDLEAKSRRLIEYAMSKSPRTYFLQSKGEIRFLVMKRFMDVLYASVGTAMDSTDPNSSWQLPLAAGAAASFYSITGTGASQKAHHVVNTASRDLIQNAWGMVSFPAVKSLMLQASRLLKGASVADRLIIAGVPCFVLSKEPAPELAAALKNQRTAKPTPWRSRMSTISEDDDSDELDEDVEASPKKNSQSERSFAGSCGQYRQRDIILHLTGGGFFAHTIASDLPYLLDWSAATGAVVICPEYALLPDHCFPDALEQVTDVYANLVDGVDLGFQVNKVVVTGESAGGNLAAALCVKLSMDALHVEDVMNQSVETCDEVMSTEAVHADPIRMPDALMLSCAALNLSLEMSHSRVVGTEDPVLPSGLISAISDAYLPDGQSKQDPLASPFFASDEVLENFPPSLLFAGSNDPLLDDSVEFNERLRCCGVQSELRAANNMPHAYWGLGTAGFPEARQVQQECEDWLKKQLLS